mmetsp:Transcript_2943/g.6671  ORF Transcript_2943/g.6671 Transcript_2943/m.6671 type:complete len:217 (+) Transcript_2943:213-863(+)
MAQRCRRLAEHPRFLTSEGGSELLDGRRDALRSRERLGDIGLARLCYQRKRAQHAPLVFDIRTWLRALVKQAIGRREQQPSDLHPAIVDAVTAERHLRARIGDADVDDPTKQGRLERSGGSEREQEGVLTQHELFVRVAALYEAVVLQQLVVGARPVRDDHLLAGADYWRARIERRRKLIAEVLVRELRQSLRRVVVEQIHPRAEHVPLCRRESRK